MANRITTEEFIKRAMDIHGSFYDYSLVKYVNKITKVRIICPIHGEFEQIASNHMRGAKCKKCSLESKRNTINEFINKAKKVHGNRYDYSKVNYKNNRIKVSIICPIHGEFRQSPDHHLSGQGCPRCGRQKTIDSHLLDTKVFIDKARKIHGNKYDYSKVSYSKSSRKVTIICSRHGEFKQSPNRHLVGNGCPKCAIESNVYTNEQFIEKARETHGNKYDYSKVEYVRACKPVTIICPKHGEFKQRPTNHIFQNGCPKCFDEILISSGHQEIMDFIDELGFEYRCNDRKQIYPFELDIYIPNKKLAIEYNGLWWHSYNRNELTEEKDRHKLKCDLCDTKNIRLIQVNENEWKNKRDTVKSVLKSKLGISNRIYARKCSVGQLNNKDYQHFMDSYHLQGYKPASVQLGLFDHHKLVSAMSFNKHPKYEWEITRFANELNTTIVGGASKLFKYFIKNHHPNQVLTYADRRYSNGNLYRKLGFFHDGFTKPNYIYIKNNIIYSRQQFQKHKLKNKLESFDPNLTEAENMFNNGYRRMWDAGHHRFFMEKAMKEQA